MELRDLVVLLLVFSATGLFAYIGLRLFTRGWESYEKRYVESTERSLDSVYLSLSPQQIVFLSLTCSLVAGIITVIIAGGELLYGLPVTVPAFFLPRLVVFILKKKRDRQFSVQLVDSLVMMGNSLRAGLSLQQAIQLIPREMQDPIKQEFRITVQEMQLGLTEEDALKNLYITAVSISRDIGGNLTEVFDNIAETIRERFRIEGRIQALTAQGKAQGMVMCVLPLAAGIFINIFNPGWMRPMFTTVWGWGMVGLIVLLEALGAFFIYKIVNIDV
jgi:tight adherence protein B